MLNIDFGLFLAQAIKLNLNHLCGIGLKTIDSELCLFIFVLFRLIAALPHAVPLSDMQHITIRQFSELLAHTR